MFPNFYHLFKDLFGIELPFLTFINTFGFFVAMAFIAANWAMTQELKRKTANGVLKGKVRKVWVGKRSGALGYVINGLLGFVFGWKILYLFVNSSDFMADPQSHIMSSEGSIPLGFLGVALAIGLKLYEEQKVKKKYPEPKLLEEEMLPHQHMGSLTLVAAIAGFLGAKFFDHLEHWDQFIQNPLAAFANPFSGLTFYGGLIVGGGAVLWYMHKRGIHWRHMLDVGAPAMMLAYAVGRIGCHLSGDGDWGTVNPNPNPGWLPDWLWGYTYPNNVAGICDPFTSGACAPGQEVVLSAPVWPTPLYETISCLILFAILWRLRKRISVPGVLFSIYLIFAGFERFWIEKIRVNETYAMLGMEITQAELISTVMMIAGVIGIFYFKRNPAVKNPAYTAKA